MPSSEGKNEPQKKRSQKKKPKKQKSKSKQRTTEKNITINPTKQINDVNNLTPENISSLRWDDKLTDPELENDRIEQYKELRRQRYIDAREQAIQNFVEKNENNK